MDCVDHIPGLSACIEACARAGREQFHTLDPRWSPPEQDQSRRGITGAELSNLGERAQGPEGEDRHVWTVPAQNDINSPVLHI